MALEAAAADPPCSRLVSATRLLSDKLEPVTLFGATMIYKKTGDWRLATCLVHNTW